MKTRTPLGRLATIAAIAVTSAATAETVTLELLTDLWSANDITPDGRYVVGFGASGPFRLDREEDVLTILPAGFDAVAISDDGTVIVGCMPDPGDGVEIAARWTEAGGLVGLGWLPDSLNCPSRSNAYEVSADGSVITGLSWDGCSGRGFVWTEATGMLELEPLANGGNRASVISADGTVIAGFAQGSFSRTPAMWDGTTTAGTLLDPPNGDVVGEVRGMTDDGTVLMGNWDGDAFTWTEAGGMQIVGDGSLAASWVGAAMDLADNGTIVGFDFLQGARRAWIQPPGADDMQTLTSYIMENGGVVEPGVFLEVCQAITPDGSTIIGHSFGQAWIVHIEGAPICFGDVDDSGAVDINDLLTLLANWGTNGPGADIADPDDVVTIADLLGLLGAWGPC